MYVVDDPLSVHTNLFDLFLGLYRCMREVVSIETY